MDLIIDRSKWLRGEGSNASFMLRTGDGKMCCLGFLGAACGIAPEGLRQIESPGAFFNGGGAAIAGPFKDLVRPAVALKHGTYGKPWCNTDVCAGLMATNDTKGYVDEFEREAAIAKGMERIGVHVTFVDEAQQHV